MAGSYASRRNEARAAFLSQFPFELIDGGLGVSLALTTTSGTSSRTELPAIDGFQVLITNYGSVACHLRFGSSSVVATTACVCILPGIPYTLTIDDDATHVAGITASGTTDVQICRGNGN
jgi:hypothetical protein